MNDALRQVFAEFGFKVDDKKLRELDNTVRKTADGLRKATGDQIAFDRAASASRGSQKVIRGLDEAVKAAADAAEKRKTFSGFLESKGEEVTDRLGASLVRTSPRLRAFGASLGLSERELGKFAAAATAAAATALALGAHVAFAFGAEFASAAEALRDTARESRVTAQELQGLDYAAVQAGVGAERARAGLRTFGEALRQGERFGNGTTSTLRRLGIETRDAAGHIRPTADLLDEVAVAMDRVESPTRKARLATQLFGESGRRMLDMLHAGPGGVRALRAELDELGGGVTPEAIEASRTFTQAQERQRRALDSLRSVLATSLLPALSWWLELSARAGGMLARLTRGTHVTELALAGLGAVAVAVAAQIVAAWAPVVAPYAATAAAIALVEALLDDLITWVEGGDSAIGRFLDTTFGLGTSAALVQELREDWEAVVGVVERAIAAVARFVGVEAGAPALGTLRPPTLGRQAPAAGPARRPVGAQAPPAAPRRVVAATQAVVAPAPAVTSTQVNRTTHRTTAPVLHFHGVTDARQLADIAVRQIRQQDASRRDADHPREDE